MRPSLILGTIALCCAFQLHHFGFGALQRRTTSIVCNANHLDILSDPLSDIIADIVSKDQWDSQMPLKPNDLAQEVNEDQLRDSSSFPELPAPQTSPDESGTESSITHSLEVGGASVSMDELGPIIVNLDGTLRRIENWATLSKQEQASTMRIISRRNKKRLNALSALEEAEQAVSDT